jgi:hypothetical protein
MRLLVIPTVSWARTVARERHLECLECLELNKPLTAIITLLLATTLDSASGCVLYILYDTEPQDHIQDPIQPPV